MSSSNISKYIADNILHQNLAIKIAQETQFKTTTTRIENDLFKKRKYSETEFDINSYVLVKYENRDGLPRPGISQEFVMRETFEVILSFLQ